MAKFYFTYGDSPAFPYQNGWTEVIAENRQFAIMAFERFHRKRPGSSFINCALIYSERDWEKTYMAAAGENFGHGCHERITVEIDSLVDTLEPENFTCIERKEMITYRREDLDR